MRISRLPTNSYLGFDGVEVARQAAACLQCLPLAPCTLSCPREADIPRVVRLAGQSDWEGLQQTRWFWDQEQIPTTWISDAIANSDY